MSMTKTHTCPKCNHNEILFVPSLADRDDRDAVRPLVLHVVHFDWKDDNEIGKISAYVCRGCGFTELYTAGARDIDASKIPGAKILHAKK